MGNYTTSVTFELFDEIGSEGANSKVYKAIDYQLNAELVVKIVPVVELVKDYKSDNPNNFFNESRILYKNKHPNIMEIQYASFDEKNIYFKMPYCKNGSLNSLINTRFLTAREILKYSLEFLSGLHYVHTNSFAHFDIKPTNILISDNNKVVLTDFGLAKSLDIYGLEKPNKTYTPHYPPEGIQYDKISTQSDIYQAGVTMYRLCNGNAIFNKQYKYWESKDVTTRAQLTKAITTGKFPDRRYYLPHIPKRLINIINKAMHIDLNKRYKTVLDLINELSKVENNVDWVYNICKTTGLETWKLKNEERTHVDELSLQHNEDNWNIYGKKIRLKDDNFQKMNKNTSEGHNSRKEALGVIKTIIEQY